MNKLNITLGIAILALLVALGVLFFQPTKIISEIKQQLGAVVGPDFFGPYWGVNEVKTYYAQQVMRTATSTVCSIQSPAATSTLIVGTVSWAVATTGVANLTFDIAKDSPVSRVTGGSSVLGGGGFATTTLLGAAGLTVVTGGSGTFIASTTPGTAIFGPNEFFVVKAANGNPTTCGSNCSLQSNSTGFAPTGMCKVEWLTTERNF